ncbi:putative HTH-type transcriptional regulator YgzD [Sporosarcina sp. NCCP-2716]|uniref:helix-turn-helix transcriptional regulator n=1 Tax=Sporosarcina sp. NCCP-2716 TaxID=2943679 RepID=UPI00203B94EF|nr:helix-turn-helix transcriptional regulator [Sporosarcina sp. NCCP-2716]GKV70189.1 putative HTH-type transcriptional regulator YgzD [Sporosarcina sp. NCCP-2716]
MLKNRLKELRARCSLTQIELAKKVGVTRQTIGFIEKGEFSPSVTLSLKLARALDCDLNEIFWLEGEEEHET